MTQLTETPVLDTIFAITSTLDAYINQLVREGTIPVEDRLDAVADLLADALARMGLPITVNAQR